LRRALIFGTLTYLPAIDLDLSAVSSRPLNRLDPWVRTILRMGVWQLYYSYHVPARAACDESVRLTRCFIGERATGFVNGLMRRLSRERPDPPKGAEGRVSVGASAGPLRRVGRLVRGSGGRGHRSRGARSARRGSRFVPNACQADAFSAWLSTDEAAVFSPMKSPWPPNAYMVTPEGHSVTATDAYEAGWFTVQSRSAMLVGLLADARPGDRVLDLCAAPGGKTGHLAERTGRQASIVACDVSPERVRDLREAMRRLGHDAAVTCEVHDATQHRPAWDRAFDLVLCDVPCSGLGLLDKRPEIRSRITREAIDRLVMTQRLILEQAARYVKPGGGLVYATCTLNPEENGRQIERFLESPAGGDFERVDIASDVARWGPKIDPSDGATGTIQLLKHRHGSDGFFIAKLRKNA
jgi:16S rRNA (cytosine967-C5)-methyltransferase